MKNGHGNLLLDIGLLVEQLRRSQTQHNENGTFQDGLEFDCHYNLLRGFKVGVFPDHAILLTTLAKYYNLVGI